MNGFDLIEDAIEDLKNGRPIIVCDDEDRENEGDLVMLAEHATPENINFMITHGKGLVCVPVSPRIAQRLELAPMTANNTDPHGTAFTLSIDHEEAKTGISAEERSLTIQRMLTDGPERFKRPGHIFPLIAKEGGVRERRGHTEAGVDLARLAGSDEIAVICEIIKEDGTMARVDDLLLYKEEHDLKLVTIEALVAYLERPLTREAEVLLPTTFGAFRMIGYTTQDEKEHVAVLSGEAQDGMLVRLHSECLTGDVFGSKRCDCGPQLDAALERIEREGGAVLYLRQEGRGIGLMAKLKAYELQEQGLDTVEANHALGYPTDMRDYTVAANMLRDLGVTKIRLMTNNPDKQRVLEQEGIEIIERVPHQVPAEPENQRYLKTKQTKLGHWLDIQGGHTS
ncbi:MULTISPECIES: bifunctional 3,4-dihydroxy-2-butanone-4-phosphate synthase/GTP cyclohydrolase II [unclassified Exiguobacterium]|uniref:bifunctional 3,4-dihydroxy-2-butanone-4-phosphate synthase/GTP cyclohydrolase II n=1 Tax=unclassified Exiguobacterium TaxID=2644629 RepID=UPI0003C3E06C|nr:MULTISPECIES: bifunctional 3,4-dihydroxy-2-butanone-4-phosphate synthase/GTP cyclohydrolase II [unclassified Exiguobacterium]AHA30863.1 3,4-dihydroxy-2-butanone 4-phosphate synthase [Exiguobacterium sp. MH3]MCQ4089066.1 bifunctional 3,4-dihydroxy-2-butanone-4-phosphate synthase/GTP cyclohydrolase II [Exiguobacterium sp. LL15]